MGSEERSRFRNTPPMPIAAEKDFYLQPWLDEMGRDPLEMEQQFSVVEADAAQAIAKWIPLVEHGNPGEILTIASQERKDFSLYVTLQGLRTLDARNMIGALGSTFPKDSLPEDDVRDLHATVLWNEDAYLPMAERIENCTWPFGWNGTDVPFATSDNPVIHRKLLESRQWIRDPSFSSDTDLAFPLSPRVILYCYPMIGYYGSPGILRADCSQSPVTISEGMVHNENQGQVFSSERFVFQGSSDFSFMRKASDWMTHNHYGQASPEWMNLVSEMTVGLFPSGGWPWNKMPDGPTNRSHAKGFASQPLGKQHR